MHDHGVYLMSKGSRVIPKAERVILNFVPTDERQTMKALSVRAPWWWAILNGKPVENRDWYTSQRGRVYIHSSKFWKIDEISGDLDDVKWMAEKDGITLPRMGEDETETMRTAGGCIVGTVEIVDCVRQHPSAFFVGKFGFVLRDPIALPKPIPFRGALGFFEVPDYLLKEARPQQLS